MKEIQFATHNKHKYDEAIEIAKNFDISVKWINVEYEEIQDNKLETIASNSCNTLVSTKTELKNSTFFVEDAGLFINVLNGFPGPYSAYVSQTIGNDGILQLMRNSDNRTAYFKSVVAVYLETKIELFAGVTQGSILLEKRGDKGFGFDPIFVPIGEELSFAEMSLTTKNLYSHRQKSLREMFTSLTAFENKSKSGE